MSAARKIAKLVNTTLAPLGLEVRKTPSRRSRPPTLRAALERLKGLGFFPATVFDVGAADGTSALYDTFPTSHHVLIEPLREFTPHLERIVARLPQAECICAAAGSASGNVVLNIGAYLQVTSRHSICDRSLATGEQRGVPAVSLSDVWRTRSLRGPALVKIDVEGDELAVLRGAEIVLKYCEYLTLEVAVREIFAGGSRIEDVMNYLAERDFLLDDIFEPAYGPAGNLTMIDLAFAPRFGLIRRLTEPASASDPEPGEHLVPVDQVPGTDP